MPEDDRTWQETTHRYFAPLVAGPPALALVPAFCLAAYWFGGEGALIVLAATLPVIYLAASHLYTRASQRLTAHPGVLHGELFQEHVHRVFTASKKHVRQSAIFVVALEEFDEMIDRYGQAAADTVSQRIGQQLLMASRGDDCLGKLSEARFAVCASPVHHLDLEVCIQMAGRLQAAVEEPISIDGMIVYASVSIGFCQILRSPGTNASDWFNAANLALRTAQRHGPSAIRAFSAEMQNETEHRHELREDVAQALELGQFKPWFQPQISTDTGKITGFEALARWDHPTRGIIPPRDFLSAIERAGLLERLAEVMMYHSFAALKSWDSSGIHIPQIGVNFAGSELSNPRLIEKIKWELDRFDLTPDRLAVEVLETVVASSPDDMITHNINALGKLGCRIDLDDFGTGHASISSMRRFAVSRIKIDRSFITKADRDPEQQRMVSAILTMAERLEVETLAEGVETVGEHVLLAQLGCDHVQGFGIAKPMPFDQTFDWIAGHNARLAHTPRIMDGKKI